jgi:hypothetical protein
VPGSTKCIRQAARRLAGRRSFMQAQLSQLHTISIKPPAALPVHYLVGTSASCPDPMQVPRRLPRLCAGHQSLLPHLRFRLSSRPAVLRRLPKRAPATQRHALHQKRCSPAGILAAVSALPGPRCRHSHQADLAAGLHHFDRQAVP